MLTSLTQEMGAIRNLSHDAQRFRTILKSFERNAELVFQGSGHAHVVDHTALAHAFAQWRKVFDQTKGLADTNRRDYVIYAAGLMMKELTTAKPIKLSQQSDSTPANLPALNNAKHLERWPEGYAYASFCVALASAVLAQDGTELTIEAITERPGFWDSFRENVEENSSNAVAFFDLICGLKPNWDYPDVAHLRAAFNPQ
jgi:hypothetical protein